ETVLFLPVALIVMLAVLYFARFGVLEERAQGAVRYGAVVSYESTSKYSVTDIYDAVALHAPPACNSTVATDTVGVLGGTGPSGSAQPFWKSDHPASAACTVATANFAGPTWSASRYIMVSKHSVSASVDVPAYITSVLGPTGNVSASLGYAHADPPSMVMYCVSSVASAVAAGLNVSYTGGSC
ncbi:MAG TPA: hypothetical protein VN224_02955, partial [Xanthomonadales bacterium]|nr:hypothetical protein [Xanthomonadales bacterium]